MLFCFKNISSYQHSHFYVTTSFYSHFSPTTPFSKMHFCKSVTCCIDAQFLWINSPLVEVLQIVSSSWLLDVMLNVFLVILNDHLFIVPFHLKPFVRHYRICNLHDKCLFDWHSTILSYNFLLNLKLLLVWFIFRISDNASMTSLVLLLWCL